MSATKLASFEPVAIHAVTGAGAPSYASGAHWWNGTAATLKPKPTSISRTAAAPATLPDRPVFVTNEFPTMDLSGVLRTWRTPSKYVVPVSP